MLKPNALIAESTDDKLELIVIKGLANVKHSHWRRFRARLGQENDTFVSALMKLLGKVLTEEATASDDQTPLTLGSHEITRALAWCIKVANFGE